MKPPQPRGGGNAEFSRAFDLLVSDPEDVVGLLAYARYKQSIREAAQNGVLTDSAARNLPPATINAFRSAAERLITRIVENAIESATPGILNSELLARVSDVQSDLQSRIAGSEAKLIGHVDGRTSFLNAFWPNLVAWFVTLLIAVSILFISNKPSIDQAAVRAIERVNPSADPTKG